MSFSKMLLCLPALALTLVVVGCAEEGNTVNEAPDIAGQEAEMLDLSNDLNSSLEMKPGEEE